MAAICSSMKICKHLYVETKSLFPEHSRLHQNPSDSRQEPGGRDWAGLASGVVAGFLSGHEYKVYDLI